MTDQEYNENVLKLLSVTTLSMEIDRPLSAVKEAMGQWDELLKDREDCKETCEGLFFDLEKGSIPLTPKNQAEIAKLKRSLYPLLLCDLGKCYEHEKRYQDAEDVLLKAKFLGSQGAEVLLFALYALHLREMGKDIVVLVNAFNRMKEIDVFSEKIVNEINNEYIHSAALSILSDFYRVFDHDNGKSFECLVNALKLEWPDDVRAKLRSQLSHFRKDYRSGTYRYVE